MSHSFDSFELVEMLDNDIHTPGLVIAPVAITDDDEPIGIVNKVLQSACPGRVLGVCHDVSTSSSRYYVRCLVAPASEPCEQEQLDDVYTAVIDTLAVFLQRQSKLIHTCVLQLMTGPCIDRCGGTFIFVKECSLHTSTQKATTNSNSNTMSSPTNTGSSAPAHCSVLFHHHEYMLSADACLSMQNVMQDVEVM